MINAYWELRKFLKWKEPAPRKLDSCSPSDLINAADDFDIEVKPEHFAFNNQGMGNANYEITIKVENRKYKMTGNMFEGTAKIERVFENDSW